MPNRSNNIILITGPSTVHKIQTIQTYIIYITTIIMIIICYLKLNDI